MPEEQKGIEVNVATIMALGWIMFGFVLLIMYTLFVYDRGIAKGMQLGQKGFYIQNYLTEPGYYGLEQGYNELQKPEITKPEIPKGKRSKKGAG
jgi:hypothetical protein